MKERQSVLQQVAEEKSEICSIRRICAAAGVKTEEKECGSLSEQASLIATKELGSLDLLLQGVESCQQLDEPGRNPDVPR